MSLINSGLNLDIPIFTKTYEFYKIFYSYLATFPKKDRYTLGRKIQRLRGVRGITQEELAEMVGISRVYMGYIEQGRESPSLKLLMKLSKKLGVKVEDLFHR